MKALAILSALIIMIGIMGLQNVAANCSDEYSGDSHSLYVADIDHPCPNPYTYADYSLYASGDGDFDLYVLDSWNDTWYKSSTTSNNEVVRVPIHCGYSHKAYVWAYSGSGQWSVCSPQVYFGEGFRRIGDSDSAPDTAFNTNPIRSNAEPDVVGRWTLTYDWDCDGSSSELELIFFSDGTFGNDGDMNRGQWIDNGQNIRWRYNEDPYSVYEGTLYGYYMSGTMSNNNGDSGCWTAQKQY